MDAYQKAWLRPDVIAGLTTAAVVVPKAMAYATIAGLPVEVGLYTAFVPMAIYAVLGTSRPLSVSTTSTIAILAAGALRVGGGTGPAFLVPATATLALLVGAMLLAASLLRLGFVADFISEPVLVGFKAGLGVVIVVDQIPKLLGIHIPHGSLVSDVVAISHGISGISWQTLNVGAATIVVLVGLEMFAPRLPAPLMAVGAGIAGAALFGFRAHGVELVGAVPRGLPALTMPDETLLSSLWPAALGIALMSFTETVAAGRAFVGPGEPAPRADRELLATGLANTVGALWGAMPAGGGTTQTAVNRLAGARSQLAELVTAGATAAIMLFLAPLIGLMPQATLAAVVIVYSIGLVRPSEFRAILQVRRMEFLWALTAFAGVMLLGTLQGIVVAIATSLAALAHQAVDPPVYELGRKRGTNVFRPRSEEHPDDETFAGLLLLRLEGRIFFANAARIAAKIGPLVDRTNPRIVAVDLGAVPDLEYTALKMLTEAVVRLRARGTAVWLVSLNPQVLAMVRRSPLAAVLSGNAMLFNLESAVSNYVFGLHDIAKARHSA